MPKSIIFCADGTWNHPGETDDGQPADTNVYKLFKALPQSATQAPHYDDGVGADGAPIDHLLGGAIGDGLFQKIKDGYTIIARGFAEGDSIFLFGFSRGAYTARCLAGMIAICGLPDPAKFTDQSTEDAFAAYRAGASRQPLLAALKSKYGNHDVRIALVGVWDTVGALGIPGDLFAGLDARIYSFLDTALHPNVLSACHALAIDERRNEFVATLWDAASIAGRDVDQLWFAGVHCDVGGGYAEAGLSDIALGWMMKKAAAKGLVFDLAVYQRYATIAAKFTLDELHESWSPLWGFPRQRQIAAGSTIANSVCIRMQQVAAYRPANLPTGFPNPVGGMSIETVVPDA